MTQNIILNGNSHDLNPSFHIVDPGFNIFLIFM